MLSQPSPPTPQIRTIIGDCQTVVHFTMVQQLYIQLYYYSIFRMSQPQSHRLSIIHAHCRESDRLLDIALAHPGRWNNHIVMRHNQGAMK